MFVKNTDNLTKFLFSNLGKLNFTLKDISNIFYFEFFCKINEEHFKVLYDDKTVEELLL